MKLTKLSIFSIIILAVSVLVFAVNSFRSLPNYGEVISRENYGEYTVACYDKGYRIYHGGNLIASESNIVSIYLIDESLYYTADALTSFGFHCNDVKRATADGVKTIVKNASIIKAAEDMLVIAPWQAAPEFPVKNPYRILWQIADERFDAALGEILVYDTETQTYEVVDSYEGYGSVKEGGQND